MHECFVEMCYLLKTTVNKGDAVKHVFPFVPDPALLNVSATSDVIILRMMRLTTSLKSLPPIAPK